MNTNLYSRLNNCTEWRIYKDSDTAYYNKSKKHFSIGFRDEDFFDCFEGAGTCKRCYFFSNNKCGIRLNTDYLMDFIRQLTNDNYISITPESYPELFI